MCPCVQCVRIPERADMITCAEINQNYDLLALAGQDVQLTRSGGWYSGPCPFCGGRDRFNLKHTENGWRWFCRGCGDGKYHTAIDYLIRRQGKGVREVLDEFNPAGDGARHVVSCVASKKACVKGRTLKT